MTKTLKGHFINVSPNSSLVCLHSLYLDIFSYIVQVLSIILVFPLDSPNGACQDTLVNWNTENPISLRLWTHLSPILTMEVHYGTSAYLTYLHEQSRTLKHLV